MPYAKTIYVYEYDELSDSAKENALIKLCEWFDYWGDDNRATLDAFINIFPVKGVKWEYGFCSPWINFTFTGDDDRFSFENDIAELSGIRLLKYLWNNYRNDLYQGKYYGVIVRDLHIDHYKSRHSKVQLENDCVLTGYYIDNAILQPIYDFMAKPDSRNFEELMYDCLYAWVKACSDDYDAWYGEENMIEMAVHNEVCFNEYGDII